MSLKPETSSTMFVLFVGIILPTSHIVSFMWLCYYNVTDVQRIKQCVEKA